MSKINYGLPYTGSKSRIVEWLVSQLPSCECFVDVFCGGCAVSHAMMLEGKAKSIILNDIQGDVPQLFVEAINGRIGNDHLEWVSRERFFERKEEDPFIRLVWSFGNDGKTYLYSHEIEPYKKAIHQAIVDDKWGEFDNLCPEISKGIHHALSFANDWNSRRLLLQMKASSMLKGKALTNPWYQSPSTLEGVHCSQHLEQINRIVSLVESSLSNIPLIISNKDYRDLIIPDNAVVFCDPPYRSSSVKYNKEGFDHSDFYDWAVETAKHHPVYITEYQIEDPRFTCIGEKSRQISLNGVGSKGKKVERLYTVI